MAFMFVPEKKNVKGEKVKQVLIKTQKVYYGRWLIILILFSLTVI